MLVLDSLVGPVTPAHCAISALVVRKVVPLPSERWTTVMLPVPRGVPPLRAVRIGLFHFVMWPEKMPQNAWRDRFRPLLPPAGMTLAALILSAAPVPSLPLNGIVTVVAKAGIWMMLPKLPGLVAPLADL